MLITLVDLQCGFNKKKMFEAVVTWVQSNIPQLFLGIVIAFIVWHVAKFYFVRFKKVEEKMNTLQCENHSTEINKIKNQEILPCKEHLQQYYDIKEDLARIQMYLAMKNPKTINAFSMKHSPRQLNEKGLELYESINGEKFLNDNYDLFDVIISEKKPKTALDVEASSLEALIMSLNLDIFNPIKNWVYNSASVKLKKDNGEEYDYSLTINDVCFILSLPLRNKYLYRHPDIEVEK